MKPDQIRTSGPLNWRPVIWAIWQYGTSQLIDAPDDNVLDAQTALLHHSQ